MVPGHISSVRGKFGCWNSKGVGRRTKKVNKELLYNLNEHERLPWLDETNPEPKYDGRQLFLSTRVAGGKRVRAVDQRRSEHIRQVVAVAIPRWTRQSRWVGRAVTERVQERADCGARRRSPGSGSSTCMCPGQFDGRRHVLPVAEELDSHISNSRSSSRVGRTIPVCVVVRHYVVDLLSVKLEYVTYVGAHDAL